MTLSTRFLASATAAAVLALVPAAAGAASGPGDEVVSLPPLTGTSSQAAARATAPDSELGPGCRDYPVRYAVGGAGEDWMLDLVISDRSGADVASISLQGVEVGPKGWTTFSVCRTAVEAGRFAVRGVLTERDGYEQIEHDVDGSRFWLTRR